MAADPQMTARANREAAATLIEACLGRGLDHFFLAPGSRCTPLTLAVADRPEARVIQHVDERGLAFACLGYGRATNRPGVFICTSGTAVANAYPAVIEASLDYVPMLLLTADRPPELRATGANQTIDQVKIFAEYTRWFFDLPCPSAAPPDRFWPATLARAVECANEGPVQINCMFREPFGGEADHNTSPFNAAAAPGVDLKTTLQWLVPRGRTLVIAGRCRNDEALAAEQLAHAIGCPFLADVTTGLRPRSYDLQLIRPDIVPADVILHVGGRIVSKRWWQFLNAHPARHYIRLTPHADRLDPCHRVSQVLHGPLAPLCLGATIQEPSPPDFLETWNRTSQTSRRIADQIIAAQIEITEPGVAQLVASALTPGDGLLLGNSMPIRDMETYGYWPAERQVRVAANRGASGIDGLIATAVGFATGVGQPTTALIGDLSALHDLNSLAMLSDCRTPVVLIIINNDGGGIFHFLPVAQQTNSFEQYFATPHGRSFRDAASMFSLDYHQPQSPAELISTYRQATRAARATVIEVFTNRRINVDLHKQIERAVREGAT